MFTTQVHVFRAGSQTSAQGVQRNFSEKDLQQVVETYDPAIHEAPLVIGHAGDNDSLPAYGWIKKFNRKGKDLYAEVAFTDTAKDLVKDGHYRKVSISFYSPDSTINPHKGKWSARHLALLGASPPAVKGLEPFSFSEEEGVFDFAVALSPMDIFDKELGPTLIVEKSPLEMLRERLEAVREDVSTEVKTLQENQQTQPINQLEEAASSSVTEQPDAAQMANPDAPQFKETSQNVGREGTEIVQQTADLENQFPEEEFMDKGKISRKHVKGAHGQVMQVVENVYDEKKKELSEDHKELPPALKKRAAEVKEQGHFAEDEKNDSKADHTELSYDEVSYKTNPSQGVVKFGKKSESDEDDNTHRYETARSADNGYVDRMKTGKADASAEVGRMETAKSSLQDQDRLDTPKSGEQDEDRLHTAKASKEEATGESRWAGQADGYDQVTNMDQYDVGAKDYPEPNQPDTSDGTDPYGRGESVTKMPTESEEMPDDEVFAVNTTNVMDDKNMRVLRQTSSQGRQPVKGGKIADFQEPKAAEQTSKLGVTAHGEGAGKPSKEKQLVPGGMDTTDEPAEVVGPEGAFAEVPRGEKKSSEKQLTPGEFDQIDEPAEEVGPRGAGFAEVKTGKKQLTPGAMDKTDVPAETSKRSGGVFSENHAEGKKDPYTKTGFGSTYDEGEGDEGVDEGEEDYNELSADHCGMNYGMGSMGQARAVGLPTDMYEELMALKQKYAELERRHAEEKMMHRRQQLSSFVEALYEEGRLTDGVMPQSELMSYCEGLEFGTLEFSEGETSATKLLNLLSKLPPMVSFGEVAGGTWQYAEEDLDPHQKALSLVEKGECADYVEAIKKTMFS